MLTDCYFGQSGGILHFRSIHFSAFVHVEVELSLARLATSENLKLVGPSTVQCNQQEKLQGVVQLK